MYLPTRLICEKNAVRKSAEALCALGSRAVIVTGGSSSRRNGALNDTCEALESGGRSFVIFDEVEQNPSVETVLKAAEQARESGCDFVVGVGGGSPLDAAKAVAFLLAHDSARAGRELLYTPGDDSRVPLALVPTTCGTGSEVTPVSVLSVKELATKRSITHKVFADLALVDGKYLSAAPLQVIRNTALDALTHMIESLINTKADEFSRMFVRGGLRLWAECMDVLEGQRQPEEEALMRLMQASAMAGMAIAQTSTTVPHGLSYPLTYKLGVPHGVAVGYFTAGYLDAADEADRELILSALGFKTTADFQGWYSRLFPVPEVSEDILTAAVDELMKNEQKLAAVPFPLDRERLLRIAGV
ncbi:MAG: iron-containing alcohol dehydrogenase [Ruminococcus sp.]|nr:iron-containing alcohol dehydrogenase [Ruminococcus sp.]